MPTYDYECGNCGHEFELFQSMSEPVKRKCPVCNRLKLQRLFGTGAAIVFKGSGFYQTDYRSESYKKGAAADKKSKDPGGKDSKSSKGKKESAAKGTPKASSGSSK